MPSLESSPGPCRHQVFYLSSFTSTPQIYPSCKLPIHLLRPSHRHVFRTPGFWCRPEESILCLCQAGEYYADTVASSLTCSADCRLRNRPHLICSMADIGCVELQGYRPRCRRWHWPASVAPPQAQPKSFPARTLRYPIGTRYNQLRRNGCFIDILTLGQLQVSPLILATSTPRAR